MGASGRAHRILAPLVAPDATASSALLAVGREPQTR
jgi:hypothetical protein